MTPEQLDKAFRKLRKSICCSGPKKYTQAQIDTLVNPAEGLLVYNTTTHKLNLFNGTDWEVVTSA